MAFITNPPKSHQHFSSDSFYYRQRESSPLARSYTSMIKIPRREALLLIAFNGTFITKPLNPYGAHQSACGEV